MQKKLLIDANESYNGQPKALLKVFGLTLLERLFVAAEKAGIKNIAIITGKNQTDIQKIIAKNKTRTSLKFDVLQSYDSIKNTSDYSKIIMVDSIPDPSNHEEISIIFKGISSDTDVRKAEKALLQKCRKPTDGIISRNFNRYISLFFTQYIAKTPLNPNQFTVFVFFIGILSALFITSPYYPLYIIGLILYKMTSILDGCDGELAKLKYRGSKLGEWMDTTCDNLTTLVFLIAISILNYRIQHTQFDYFLGMLSSSMYIISVLFLMATLYLKNGSGSLVSLNSKFKTNKGKVGAFFAQVIRRDFFALFFVVLGLFNLHRTILAINLIATFCVFIFACKNVGSLLRERRLSKESITVID